MGLADAGRAADEQRVVRLRWHLGDRQRGGVGEPVAVADHELVEGELGVAERARRRARSERAVRIAAGARCEAGARCAVGGASGACGRGGPLAAATSSTLALGPRTSSTLAWMTLPKRSRIQRQRVRRRLDDEAVVGELDGAQRLEPDAVGGLVDDERKLGLHPRPYVLELEAHGSVSPLLSQRQC